jgi:hypothetical protein
MSVQQTYELPQTIILDKVQCHLGVSLLLQVRHDALQQCEKTTLRKNNIAKKQHKIWRNIDDKRLFTNKSDKKFEHFTNLA